MEEKSVDRSTREMLALRREMYARIPVAQVAFSSDGRSVGFAGPVECGLRTGSVGVVEPADEATGDPAIAVQLRAVRLVERAGPQIDVKVGDSEFAGVGSIAGQITMRAVAGDAAVLGTFGEDGFRAGDSVAPFGERPVRAATAEEIASVQAGLVGDEPAIEVGVLRDAPATPALLRAKGFARHTFMCGQSGSGKTYTTGGLFERLLASTTLPIVVLDPNSDHVHLGALRDPDDHSPAAERHRTVADSVVVARARGAGGDLTLCANFSELEVEWQALILQLHPIRDLDEYDAFRRVTASLPTPYSVHDVLTAAGARTDDPLAVRLAHRIANLGVADWDVWRRDGETSIVGTSLRQHRLVVLDVGSLPSPDERSTVALVLLGNQWRRRGDREPRLIAIDEAHNVLPAVTDNPLLQATADLGVLIAGEGRKFGLHLFVATQRPGKVHPNVVSQCDNLILMRMNGAGDVDELVTMFSHVPEPLIREALAFGLGQALFAGPISPVPVLAKVGARITPEGGGDVPTAWAARPT
jgi:DNA helicase HerA-like ATPase